jgi:hypothetical protein
MISGLRSDSLKPKVLLLAVSVFFAALANASEFDVDALMDMLSSVRKSEASFTETRHLAMLDSPLVLTGTLSYSRPDRLEKKVNAPHSERLSVEGDKLTFESKGKVKVVALDREPVLRAFVESIRATRSGDQAALERFYQLDLTGDPGAWTLTLKPNDSSMRRQVKAIVMSGQNERIVEIEVLETGGDRSIMVINEKAS